MTAAQTMLLLFFAAPAWSADAPAQAAGLTVTGDFCEVIWAAEKWERVSCLSLSKGPAGVQVRGTAFSWARKRDDGTVVAPELARWQLDDVVSYDAASKTLVYAYSGTLTNTGRPFQGKSSIQLDFSAEKTTPGWYGVSEEPVKFRLLPLADLEACLGVDKPSDDLEARFKRVATSFPKKLKTCVPETPG